MPRLTAKSILEGCREQVKEYGMDGYSISTSRNSCCCPRGLVRAQSNENVLFGNPKNGSAKKALKMLDKAAESFGCDGHESYGYGREVGPAAEEYAKKIASKNVIRTALTPAQKQRGVKFIDKALELL